VGRNFHLPNCQVASIPSEQAHTEGAFHAMKQTGPKNRQGSGKAFPGIPGNEANPLSSYTCAGLCGSAATAAPELVPFASVLRSSMPPLK